MSLLLQRKEWPVFHDAELEHLMQDSAENGTDKQVVFELECSFFEMETLGGITEIAALTSGLCISQLMVGRHQTRE